MRLARLEAIPIAYPEPNDHNRKRSVCLVKASDTDGRVGWGECATYFPEATRAAAELVTGLAPLVVGEDPVATRRIWERLRHHTWWYGTGAGLASMAIAGIDMALWDLKGRILERSVLDLLGGPVHEKMQAVASIHGTGASIDEMAEAIAEHVSHGFFGIKVGFGKRGEAHLGYEHDRDVAFVKAVREAIGPHKRLMIDLGVNNFWDVPTAIRRARAFEPHDIHWLEEPLGHDDPNGYAALRAATALRLGYGERESTPVGVEKILATGTVDVVGLDPGRIEGITGFMTAADLCALHRRQANAHNFSTAIVGAASAALSFASPACRELEIQPAYGPAQRDLVDVPLLHDDGYVRRPTGHGLGITLDEAVLASLRMDSDT